MKFVGIDLAERLSAVGILAEDGSQVYVDYFDAGISRKPAQPLIHIVLWMEHFTPIIEDYLDPGDLVAIEDLHSSGAAYHVRMPLRFQGALLALCHQHGLRSRLTLPREWRKGFGYDGTKSVQTPRVWAKDMCVGLGYDFHGTKGKSLTDMRDALLIAEWARTHWDGEKVDAAKSNQASEAFSA